MVATITVGTNSFVTDAESLTILEEFVHAGAWSTALNRVTSLITAYYDITNLTLIDPDTSLPVDASSAPTAVKQAQSLLAFDFSQKPALATASGQGGTNVKSVGAGSARVGFFRPEDPTRFPTIVQRLLAPFLTSTSGSLAGSCATGTDGTSSFLGTNNQLNEGYK